MLMTIGIFQIQIYYLLELKDDFIEKIKSEIPELPDEKKKRFIDKFNLSLMKQTFWFQIKRHQNILKKL